MEKIMAAKPEKIVIKMSDGTEQVLERALIANACKSEGRDAIQLIVMKLNNYEELEITNLMVDRMVTIFGDRLKLATGPEHEQKGVEGLKRN